MSSRLPSAKSKGPECRAVCGTQRRDLLFHSFTLAFLCALCVLPSVTGACPDLVGVLPSLFSSHQIRQYFARTIFCPSLHPNASRNSGKFDTTLFTRYFG